MKFLGDLEVYYKISCGYYGYKMVIWFYFKITERTASWEHTPRHSEISEKLNWWNDKWNEVKCHRLGSLACPVSDILDVLAVLLALFRVSYTIKALFLQLASQQPSAWGSLDP